MINRRLFIKTLAVAAATPTHSAFASRAHGFGRLVADRKRIIDLPDGFEYRVIARMGDEMSDGLLVPGYADGMSAFEGNDGRINLVCNHELGPSQMHVGPFGSDYARIDRIQSTKTSQSSHHYFLKSEPASSRQVFILDPNPYNLSKLPDRCHRRFVREYPQPF